MARHFGSRWIEPIRDDKTRPRFECRAIRGFFRDRLGLRVDHRGAGLVVLRPARNEAPTHHHGFAPSLLVEPHHDAALHGRGVEARFEIGDRMDVGLGDPIQIDEFAPRVLVGETTTHQEPPLALTQIRSMSCSIELLVRDCVSPARTRCLSQRRAARHAAAPTSVLYCKKKRISGPS